LPDSVKQVAVGSGGRYLILHLTGQRKLAVFDVQQGAVARYLPLAEEVIHFAAGATQLAVIYPVAKQLQIWNLPTGEKQRTVLLPGTLTGDEIHQVCMGSASTGPLFVYLPHEKRTLAVDLEQLDKSGGDYLVVLSRPPTAAAGKLFSYRLDIRSRKGGVKAKLESGPPGLQVSQEGQVTWNVPADFKEAEGDVLLTLSDASGQEVFHNFKISIER
jgi:hypothetical protein